MDLSDLQRRYLLALWEEVGGETDNIHEFWDEVKRRGLRINHPKVSFFADATHIGRGEEKVG